MAARPFDLEQIRKNWARAASPKKAPLPPRLATVKAPRDQIARALDGKVTEHHRFMLRLHLRHIGAIEVEVQVLEEQIGAHLVKTFGCCGLMTMAALAEEVVWYDRQAIGESFASIRLRRRLHPARSEACRPPKICGPSSPHR